MTLLLCVFCLSAGTWITVYVYRREQRLVGASAPVLAPTSAPILSGSVVVLDDLAVDLPTPGPDRSPAGGRG